MNAEYLLKAQEILEKMTLKEKIGQMTQISYNGKNFDAVAEKIEKYGIGSIILAGSAFAGNTAENGTNVSGIDRLQKTAVENTRCGIPLLFGRDVIHSHKTVYPINLAMAASFDPEAVEHCYNEIRDEAAADGVNWTFAPMLDFCHEPRWGRIIECQGEDPYLASKMAGAIVKGFQGDDLKEPGMIAACAKHYIGYGASEGGRDYNHTEISDYALYNNYLPAFRSAVDAGVATVMNSFNEVNGVPVAASRRLLTDVLRGDLGFDGFVISDWASITQLKNHGLAADNRDAAKKSLYAGIDMDMVDNCYLDHIEELVTSGEVDITEVDTAVLRILYVKLRLGLFEHPYRVRKEQDLAKHIEDSKLMCEKSMVLLKNEGGLLPLKKEGSYCLTGPFLKERQSHVGAWSLATESMTVKNIEEAVREAVPGAEITVLDEIEAQYVYPRNCDVIICFLGEPKCVTGEAQSLADIGVTKQQAELVKSLKKSGKPVVGVLCYGRPTVLTEVEPLFDAMIYAWHGGTMAATAIAEVLFGDAEPTGRLPVTLPMSVGQLPLYYNALPGARIMNGYYNGESRMTHNYNDCPGTPLYPFGYGLSYGKFDYSVAAADESELSFKDLMSGRKFRVSVDVTNTSDVSSTETVQLYVRDKVASRVRPLRELKGFKKITVDAGKTETVSFGLSLKELGFYLEDGSYITEPGEFEIYVGENCLTENSVTVKVTA